MADQLVVDRDAALIGEAATATFSPRREYRYVLTRRWQELTEGVMWIMCNPSTADAFVLDPTIRRCQTFTRSWGYGGLAVVNIFGLRSTDPRVLYRHPDPIGRDNDSVIGEWLDHWAGPVVAAWGVHGAYRQRGEQVAELVRAHGKRLMCLGVTKDGHPKHPLYVPGTTSLVEIEGGRQ